MDQIQVDLNLTEQKEDELIPEDVAAHQGAIVTEEQKNLEETENNEVFKEEKGEGGENLASVSNTLKGESESMETVVESDICDQLSTEQKKATVNEDFMQEPGVKKEVIPEPDTENTLPQIDSEKNMPSLPEDDSNMDVENEQLKLKDTLVQDNLESSAIQKLVQEEETGAALVSSLEPLKISNPVPVSELPKLADDTVINNRELNEPVNESSPLNETIANVMLERSVKKIFSEKALEEEFSQSTDTLIKELRPIISKNDQDPHEAPGYPQFQEQTPIKTALLSQGLLIKKEELGTDDLATLANAALTCDQANGGKLEEPARKEPVWCDVGIIKGNSCHVTYYHEPPFSHDSEHENITTDNLPNFSNRFKIDLEPGTAYKFRVCAINSCGRGPWSEISAFKTCLPGYPGAPSSIKISKSAEGAHLSWEPPSNPAGTIIEYSVCLAVKNTSQTQAEQKGQQLAFVRVYSGPQNQTVVPNVSLAAAHIDTTSKPAIIFRIAAKNEKGFGPATQVRWLQDVLSSPTGGVKTMPKKTEPIVAPRLAAAKRKLDDY